MGLFSFGNKSDTPSRRGGSARSSRAEPRRRRMERSGDASAKDTAYAAEAMLLDPTLPEKQRARRRLVGAIALVIAAVIVLPMVLDSHPKPVTDDIAIDIPNRAANVPARAGDDPADVADVANPTTDPQAVVAPDNAGVAAAGVTQLASSAADTDAPDQSTTRTQPAKPARSASSGKPAGSPQQPAAPTVQQALSSPATKPQVQKQAAKSATMPAFVPSAANADSGTPATPAGARFAVQLGMFADDASARRWERKLKAAGVPAYIERRKQADGSTRALLRAGPFPDRAAASAAIAKVREAGLTANAAQ
jgi:DedD protein